MKILRILRKFWDKFLCFWAFINLLCGHVSCQCQIKFEIYRFCRFDVYWIQTDKHTDKNSIYRKNMNSYLNMNSRLNIIFLFISNIICFFIILVLCQIWSLMSIKIRISIKSPLEIFYRHSTSNNSMKSCLSWYKVFISRIFRIFS